MRFKSILLLLFLFPGGLLAFWKQDVVFQGERHRLTIPFENRNGSIILTLKINDYPRPLRLLFDTGADGMAVSQALADSIGLVVSRTQRASVVGGHMDIKVSSGNTVHLDSLAFGNQGIAIFPELHRDGTDGIIGNTLSKRYIVQVDYDRQRLSLYDFGSFDYPKDGFSVPVATPRGNIELSATLSITAEQAVESNFFFDTGAGYHLMVFRPFVKEHRLLVNGFKPDSVSSTLSMGMATPVFNGRAYAFSFSDNAQVKDMPVTLMGGSAANQNWDPGVAGSIGVGLISQYNFIINLADKQIYFVPRQAESTREQH